MLCQGANVVLFLHNRDGKIVMCQQVELTVISYQQRTPTQKLTILTIVWWFVDTRKLSVFFARSITLINTDRHQFSKYSGWLESRTEKWEQSVSMTCLDLVTNVYRRTSRCYRNQFWILQGESQVILILSINSYEHVVLTVYLWLCYYMVWQNICATLADHTQKGISTVKNKVKS